VALVIPEFPYSHQTGKEVVGLPLYGLTEGISDQFHPCEMLQGDETELATAGDYIGIATGTGATVREAAKGAYRVLNKLHLPGSPFYRIDIGRRLARQLPQLQEHGYATGLVY
jgi:phosphoribosylamine--glycine ligase